MANKIEVIVEGRETTIPVLAGVKKEAEELEDDLKKSGDKAGKALGEGISKGAVQEAIPGLAKLDKAIAETTNEIKKLAAEAVKTGKTDFSAEIIKQQKALREMVNLRKLIVPEESEVKEVAEDIGKKLSLNLEAVFGTLGKSPGLIGGLVGVGIGAAPGIAAIVSGAVIGAVGAGGIIGGVALLKNDSRVQAAGKDLGNTLLSELQQAASPAILPLLNEISKVKSRIGDMGDELTAVFRNSFQNIDGLTDPIMDGVERLVEAFANVTAEIDPIWDALGGAGKEILFSFADGLELLSENATAVAAGIEAFGKTIGLLLDVGFGAIDFLVDMYEWSLKVRSALGDDGATEALEKFKAGAHDAAPAAMDFVAAEEDAEKKAKELADSLKEVNDELFKLSGQARGVAQDEIDLRNAFKAAKDAVEDKTKATDGETEALIRAASATDDMTQSMMDNGASQEDIQKHIQNSKDKFIDLAREMGYTKEDAEDLAEDFITFPDLEAYAHLRGVEQAKKEAKSLKEYLHKIPDEDIRVAIRVTGASAARAAANYAKQYQASGGPSRAAVGGGRGGLTWVGEMGPELVRLPYGSHVFNNGQSMQMAAQSGDGGGGDSVEIVSRAGDPWKAFIDAMIPHLQIHVKRRGSGRVDYLAGK